MNPVATPLRKILQQKLLQKPSHVCTRNEYTSAQHCLDLVKKHDYENFLCVLLLNKQSRTNALAIRALNVELAKIADNVKDERMGLMRLHFWEETVDSCFEDEIAKIPKHPIALELHKTINKQKLTKRHFTQLINSRKEQFNISLFPTIEDQETYCEKSNSTVYYLILEGANIRNLHADHVASHLGKAQGIVQQIKALRFASEINAVFLPQNLLAKHEVSYEEIIRRKSSQRLNESIFELSSRALQHLDKAEALIKDTPMKSRTVFLPTIPTRFFLTRLEKCNFDPLHPHLHRTPAWWIAKIWWQNQKYKR